jgi:hypothetical protein
VDGVPLEQMLGIDEHGDYWKIGMSLFEDVGKETEKKLNRSFSVADLLSNEFPKQIAALVARADPSGQSSVAVVYLGSVLHLLTEEQVKIAVKNCKVQVIHLYLYPM